MSGNISGRQLLEVRGKTEYKGTAPGILEATKQLCTLTAVVMVIQSSVFVKTQNHAPKRVIHIAYKFKSKHRKILNWQFRCNLE